MKLVFAGTPGFAVPSLRALIRDGHQVEAVYTQPDKPTGRGRKISESPVKKCAQEERLVIRQPESLRQEASHLRELDCDLMVVVAYGQLLPQDVLGAPRLGCVNVHASILPRWRGAAPIQRAIEAGDTETGVSIMRMEIGLDTGPVYRVATTPISNDDTTISLHNRLADLGADALATTVRMLATEGLVAVEQDDRLATYARKLDKSEAEIDWAQPVAVIDRRIRAFNPWPVCQTIHEGSRIRIWSARIVDSTKERLPVGIIAAVDRDQVLVSCGDGLLGLSTLQRDGGKPLPVESFLPGYPLSVGDQLGGSDRTTVGHSDVGTTNN